MKTVFRQLTQLSDAFIQSLKHGYKNETNVKRLMVSGKSSGYCILTIAELRSRLLCNILLVFISVISVVLVHLLPHLFPLFYFSRSFIGFTYFLLLSIPSLSTRIVSLRFQAGGRRRRPNLALVYFVCVICIP